MLYLQTSIHLKKIEVLVFIHHKLQCPGTVITYFLTGFHSYLQHLLSRLLFHKRRRTFFYHLLVTTLNGTFTFIQMNDISILISHDLNFDMMRILNIFFNINRIIAKGCPCFGLRQTESSFHLFFRTYQTHTFSSTSRKCFQHNRIANFISYLLHFINALYGCFGSGHNRQSCFPHNLTGLRLDPHFGNNIRTRSDKNHSLFFATAGKIRILRQETISRMNSGSGLFGNGQYQFRL